MVALLMFLMFSGVHDRGAVLPTSAAFLKRPLPALAQCDTRPRPQGVCGSPASRRALPCPLVECCRPPADRAPVPGGATHRSSTRVSLMWSDDSGVSIPLLQLGA